MTLDTQAQVDAAERTLRLTWAIVVGTVIFSVLTVTPLVLRVTPDGWGMTAPILPIVVDAAVVIAVRVDAIVARLDGQAGFWPALLRWLTGLMTLALNVGDSALRGDLVGVGVHAVAPTLLIVTAEASLKWRRAITAAVARIERERAEADALTAAEHRAREDRERADQEAARQVAERQREQERADREREREHAAQLVREEREHAARLEREREDRADTRAAVERDAVAREKREERERADRLRREEQERKERERRAQEARERVERERRSTGPQKVAAASVNTDKKAVSIPVSTTAHEAPAEKMTEDDARTAVAQAVREGRSQRQTAALTGWSTGWVAARYRELEQVPGQLEMSA